MPKPRVFVSSTFYDLRYIRENVKYFIRNLGYEPVLSEDGEVFYDPALHVQESCIIEIPSCQIFVLIIGGRHGSSYKETDRSVTNAEYDKAIQEKIPVFALVEKSVLEQYQVYKANPKAKNINYPAVDSFKVFDFIDKVKANTVNNALVPFSDFEELQNYLKQQWASMLYSFLTTESEAKKVSDMFTILSETTKKIEFLTGQMVNSVGDQITKLTLGLYDHMVGSDALNSLLSWNLKFSPWHIIKNERLEDLCNNQIVITKDKGWVRYGGGPPYRLSKPAFEHAQKNYSLLRNRMLAFLEQNRLTKEEYLKAFEDKKVVTSLKTHKT